MRKVWHKAVWKHAGLVSIAGAMVFICACENGGNSSSPSQTESSADQSTGTGSTSAGTDSTSVASTDPFFPDGIHPTRAANAIIASEYGRHIDAVPDGIAGNDSNTVVCLGDSITASGYPNDLASMTGKNVINAGHSGEESGGGASRVDGVLDQYHPAYLCILYGANDVRNGVPSQRTKANLQSIINAARAKNTIPIIGTLTPMSGDFDQFEGDARALSAQIRSLAAGSSTALADLDSAF